MDKSIKYGTCSWKYDSWVGLVYPDFGHFNYLEEYSKKYNTVEIDQWFWSLFGEKVKLPDKRTVVDYNNSTPDDFKFTIKAPNSLTLTHHYRSNRENEYFLSKELMESFLDSIEPLKLKTGMLMFQFEYLNKKKMPSLDEFIRKSAEFINSFNTEIPLGIEIRNPNYLKKEYFEFLKEYKITPVFLQGYYMPKLTEVYENFKEYVNDRAVIRLHGYDRKGIEKKTNMIWNEIVEPKDDELSPIAEMINNLHSRGVDIYVNVNNHYEGSAPITIEKLKKLTE